MELVFVTREGCGLCERAERALWSLAVPYVRREVDQAGEFSPYARRLPVLLLGGEVLLEGAFAEPELLALMEGLLGGQA